MNLQPHFIPNARGLSYADSPCPVCDDGTDVWLRYEEGVLDEARCEVCGTAWTPEQLADLERGARPVESGYVP